jgi:hypothetical protein
VSYLLNNEGIGLTIDYRWKRYSCYLRMGMGSDRRSSVGQPSAIGTRADEQVRLVYFSQHYAFAGLKLIRQSI